jgi:hypothetical protein
MAKLLPFVSVSPPFIAEPGAFMAQLAARQLHLLPFMAEEHLSLDELALFIAD